MAGDWIKMRAMLPSDPRVLAMADFLADRRDVMNWLTDEFRHHCSETAYEYVTRNVMVAVTVTGLLRYWSVAVDMGRADGDDLVLACGSLDAIEAIAGIPGFGFALEHVGWAIEEPKALRLPKFLLHNVPAEDRLREKNAERQRRYRERKSVTSRVTLHSNAREEKRRELQLPLTAAPSANGKARKKPTGPHADAVAWWCSEFERTRGSAYAFRDKADGRIVRDLVGQLGLDEFSRRATSLLESADPFYRDKGCDLGTLRSAWNKLAAPKAPTPSYMRPTEPEPTGPRVDPAIARKAIKDALAAVVGKQAQP